MAAGSGTSVMGLARLAGALYVVLFVLGPFVFLYGKAAAFVPGDVATTAQNILGLGGQFRVGLVIEATIAMVEVLLAAILFVIFRPVSLMLSLAAAFARLGEAIIQGANLLTSILLLYVLTEGAYVAAFTTDQTQALGHLFLNANEFMILVWGIFFGFHLALLSVLIYRSGFLPRWLGVLIAFSGVGYLMQSFGTILWPGASDFLNNLVVALAVPGELALAGWLLFKGVDAARWRALADR